MEIHIISDLPLSTIVKFYFVITLISMDRTVFPWLFLFLSIFIAILLFTSLFYERFRVWFPWLPPDQEWVSSVLTEKSPDSRRTRYGRRHGGYAQAY
jgi:hypothetical protein